MKNLKFGMSLVLLSFVLSACGNRVIKGENYLSGGQFSSVSQASSNAYLPADMRCSESPNILANNGSTSLEFRGCKSAASQTAVKIFPTDDQNHSVCVFPSLNGSVNPNVYHCGMAQTSGSTLNFGSVNFNAVYIVDSAELQVMRACVQYGDIQTCATSGNLPLAYGAL